MGSIVELSKGWKLLARPDKRHGQLSEAEVAALLASNDGAMEVPTFPMQVHEILAAHGRIQPPKFCEESNALRWVSETDWIYKLELPGSASSRDCNFQEIICPGLDTVVDVWCDYRLIGAHRNCFLPGRWEICCPTDSEAPEVLLLHFHAAEAYAERELANRLSATDQQNGVLPLQLLRKPRQDFTDFLGPVRPSVGPYRPIFLKGHTGITLNEAFLQSRYHAESQSGSICVHCEGYGRGILQLEVFDPEGSLVAEEKIETRDDAAWEEELATKIPNPELWHPRGYGAQSSYRIRLSCGETDEPFSTEERVWETGFSDLQHKEDFQFCINGKPFRLWGVNIPPASPGHVWDRSRVERIFHLAELCNANTLRLWGPGQPCDNAHFLQEADRRGFMVWMEFPHDFFPTPENEEFCQEALREAEWIVRENQHHPSVLLWSGGNESHLMLDSKYLNDTEARKISSGRKFFKQDLSEVVAHLDPDRLYHSQSPCGGSYANSPQEGDTHCYNDLCVLPGIDFPIMATEHFRASFPSARSMCELLGDDAWQEGFQSRLRGEDGEGLLPTSWRRMGMGGSYKNYMLGPIGDFYDHADTIEGLIDRLNAGSMKYLRETVERFRRGRRSETEPRRTRGHLWWKFQNTYPMLRNAVVDSLLEPTALYYALQRAHAPLLLSFEMDASECIRLWVINDTGHNIQGEVHLRRLDDKGQQTLNNESIPLELPHDQSRPVFDCSVWGSIMRNTILTAEVVDDSGSCLTSTHWVPAPEIACALGNPKLLFSMDNHGRVFLETNHYARRVALSAVSAEGNWKGWDFTENYFDLVPGHSHPVRWCGPHNTGTLTATCIGCQEPATVTLV